MLSLAFADPKLESEFLDGHCLRAQRQLRLLWPTASLILLGMYRLDRFLTDSPAFFDAAIKVRWFLVVPAFALGFAATFLLTPARRRVGVPLTLLAAGVSMLSITTIGLTYELSGERMTTDLIYYGSFAFTLSVLAFQSLLGLRWWQITAVCVAASGFAMGYSVVSDYPKGAMALHTFWILAANTLGGLSSFLLERARRDEFLLRREVEAERRRSEALLLNVLPPKIAERLKAAPDSIADSYADATILFADLVGFTPLAKRMTPTELVALLNDLFTEFDQLAERYGLEKIKTIGDAYMVVGGVPEPSADHTARVAALALDALEAVERLSSARGLDLKIRVGIHVGSVVAGVIGKKKFSFDLWGDAVNTASRLESHGSPGRVHVSDTVAERLGDQFALESRGEIELKGKGLMRTFWLDKRGAAKRAAS